MGVDSGIPYYREFDDNKFWEDYPMYKKHGVKWEDLENKTRYLKYPDWIWGYFEERRKRCGEAKPHVGYEVLLDIVNSP